MGSFTERCCPAVRPSVCHLFLTIDRVKHRRSSDRRTDLHQTCTQRSAGGSSSRVCSRSRSKVTRYGQFCRPSVCLSPFFLTVDREKHRRSSDRRLARRDNYFREIATAAGAYAELCYALLFTFWPVSFLCTAVKAQREWISVINFKLYFSPISVNIDWCKAIPHCMQINV